MFRLIMGILGQSVRQPRRKNRTGGDPSFLSLEVLEDRVVPTITVWTGADSLVNDNWSDAKNWSDGVPGPKDTAEFNTDSAESQFSIVDTAFKIQGLLMTSDAGGIMFVKAPLVLTGISEWDAVGIDLDSANGGSLTNNGIITSTNQVGISGNGTFTNNGTIIRHGTTNDLGVGGYDNGQGLSVELDNTSRGIINLLSDSGFSSGNGYIVNSGTIKKTGGSGTSAVFVSMKNTGIIDAESGTIRFIGVDSSDTGTSFAQVDTNGTFKTATGAAIELADNGYAPFVENGTFHASGSGTILLDAGELDTGPAGATFKVASTVTFSWNNASINVPAMTTLTYDGPLSINGDGFAALDGGGTFLEHGTITVSATGSAAGLAIDDGNNSTTTLDIAKGSILDFQSDAGIFVNCCGESLELVVNAGTIEKTGGTGTSSLTLPLTNTGTVKAQSGTLALSATTDTNGTFKTAKGAFIDLAHSGAELFTENKTFNATGSGTLLLDSGTLSGGPAGATFKIARGVTFSWSDAYISTSPKATLTFNGALSVDSTHGPTLYGGGTFVEHGTITESGPGNLDINPGNNTPTTLVLASKSVFDFQSDSGILGYNSTLLTNFVNGGTVEKTGGTGTSLLNLPLTNKGVVQVRSGTIQLTSGLSLNKAATLRSAPAGTLSVPGNVLGSTRNAKRFAPLGTVLLTGSGPQLLEVMSRDRSNKASGFVANFAYGTLEVAQGSDVQLVDQSRNSSGKGHEALYVDTLIVHGTLDLNHLHVYARVVQSDGQVIHGKVSLVP